MATLARLAWPVVLGQLGLVAMGVVDVLMVGRLGPDPLAAVGVGNTLSFGALIVGLGTASGIDPLVAQAYGGGDDRAAGRALARGAVVVAAVAVPIVAVHLGAEPLLALLGQPQAVLPDAGAYCRILTAGVAPFLGFVLLRQFLQGSGRMRPAMWVVGAGNVVNVVADWALIYGHLGAPALGVAGAAWATVIVRWAMLALLVVLGRDEVRRTWSWSLDRAGLRDTALVAVPVGLQLGVEVWAFNAAAFMSGWLGATALAAHTVAISITSVAFMIPLGVGAAAATRVGNLVGAGRPWRPAGRAALGTSTAVMVGTAAVMLGLPGPLVRLYTDDPAVVALAVVVLPIGGLFQLVDGVQVTAFGVLRGLGDTRVPAVFNVVGHWALGLPAGAILAFGAGWGLAGIWTGITIGLATVAAMLLVRLRHTV